MSITLVGHAKTVTLNATTSAINTTGATLLISILKCSNSQGTPSDSLNNTWVQAINLTSTVDNLSIYYAINAKTGTSHTFSNASGQVYGLYIMAFSGAGGPDKTNSNALPAPGPYTSIQAGSINPSFDGELIICGLLVEQSPGSLTIDSSFAIVDSDTFSSGVLFGGGSAYLVQSTASAVNPTWSFSTTVIAIAGIVSFTKTTSTSQQLMMMGVGS